jgi:YegS/Rv2252/BmrU family lipid kinase
MNTIKRILVLVNPAAANNTGRQLWEQLANRFDALFSQYERQVVETTSLEHSIELGASVDADLLISVGGDGAVHSVAQGIMRRAREDRPALTMIPVGSGNDFARTLGIPFKPLQALELLASGRQEPIDVGRCNTTFFLETLSFGIDAAIAIKTIELRKTVHSSGLPLYARAAVSAILHELKPHHITITTDTGERIDDDLLICAVQNGPTYGGGFRIAPGAHANDGLFDICMATNVSKPYALYALALISQGKHERLSVIKTLTARKLTIELGHDTPAQCDGEPLQGTRFDIELLPSALDVLMPPDASL